MKKYYLVCMMLFAACLNSGFAQTISTQKGLTTAIFNLPAGIIKVYLPDDIRPGDMISGSVSAEAAGKNAKEMTKNLADLKKYNVEFNGQKLAVSEAGKSFQCNISKAMQPKLVLNLMSGNGENAGYINIEPSKNGNTAVSPSECKIPTHALTAAPLIIRGHFDGDASNTKCTLNNEPLEILAESPQQCFIAYPENGTGIQTLHVQEHNKTTCSQQVSGVEMHVSAGKLNLLRGEKTYINVEITGLQNLPDTAKLTLANMTRDIVHMLPSDDFYVLLPPDSTGTGTYKRNFEIQSTKKGSFTVNVNLVLPEPTAVLSSVNTGVEKPPVYADDNGGIALHPLKVDGLKNGMSDAFKKAVIEVTGNRANKYPELDDCGSCLKCIQSMLDEGKVALVGEIGKILMEHYVDLLVSGTGGALAWIKDKYDKLEKAGDIADAIANAVAKNELQVVEFEERMCGYCLVSAIGFYDTKTGCMDAFFYCKGKYNCCNHLITIIHLKYCVNEDGFKKKDSGLTIDVITK
jgi:hypothetical protein